MLVVASCCCCCCCSWMALQMRNKKWQWQLSSQQLLTVATAAKCQQQFDCYCQWMNALAAFVWEDCLLCLSSRCRLSHSLEQMMSRAIQQTTPATEQSFNSDSSARGHATHFAVCCCCCSFCCHCFHFCCCCPLLLRKPRGCWCYCCRFWSCCCCCSCFPDCWLWGIWYLQMCWQWICRPATYNISCLPLYHDPFPAMPLHAIRSVAMQLKLVVNSVFTLFLVWEKNSLTCQQMLPAKGLH